MNKNISNQPHLRKSSKDAGRKNSGSQFQQFDSNNQLQQQQQQQKQNSISNNELDFQSQDNISIDKQQYGETSTELSGSQRNTFLNENNIQQDEEFKINNNQISIDIAQQQQQQEIIQQILPEYPKFEKKRIILKNQKEFAKQPKLLSIRYDLEDKFIAIGADDGLIRIINSQNGQELYPLYDKQEQQSPVTVVRWCPQTANSNCQHTLLSAYSGGQIIYWHTTSQQVLHRYIEPDNSIDALDINNDGTKFASAGIDTKVRIYDVGKKSQPTIMESGEIPAHSNRVYCVKWLDQNPNLFLSAGWDGIVLHWDIRTRYATNYIYGAKVYGDSLDVKQGLALTGSWREDKQLQIWDLRKFKKELDIIWTQYDIEPSFVYSCQFCKHDNNYILAGSTGACELRLFNRKAQNQCIDILKDTITKGVFCLDFANKKKTASFICSDGKWGEVDIDFN